MGCFPTASLHASSYSIYYFEKEPYSFLNNKSKDEGEGVPQYENVNNACWSPKTANT